MLGGGKYGNIPERQSVRGAVVQIHMCAEHRAININQPCGKETRNRLLRFEESENMTEGKPDTRDYHVHAVDSRKTEELLCGLAPAAGKKRTEFIKEVTCPHCLRALGAKVTPTPSATIAANIIMYSLIAMGLLTIAGAWLKWFWLGWVFAGGC